MTEDQLRKMGRVQLNFFLQQGLAWMLWGGFADTLW